MFYTDDLDCPTISWSYFDEDDNALTGLLDDVISENSWDGYDYSTLFWNSDVVNGTFYIQGSSINDYDILDARVSV